MRRVPALCTESASNFCNSCVSEACLFATRISSYICRVMASATPVDIPFDRSSFELIAQGAEGVSLGDWFHS